MARDIILAIDGVPLPQLKPDRTVVTYIEREIAGRSPGETMALTVLRGTERLELAAVLGDEPRLIREAERRYFDRIGFTAREFVYGDAVERRVNAAANPTAAAFSVGYHLPTRTAARSTFFRGATTCAVLLTMAALRRASVPSTTSAASSIGILHAST